MLEGKDRKQFPLFRGLFKYFPNALLEVSHVSYVANEQHHPGENVHWDKTKSQDEADALLRHLLESGGLDTDGLRHSAKAAWRALALLERELSAQQSLGATRVESSAPGLDASELMQRLADHR